MADFLAQPEPIALRRGSAPDLSELFRSVFYRLGIKHPAPTIEAAYYPFAGLRSTIRLRNNHVDVRISDVLDDAPRLVLEALAEILLTKVFRKRASREARECYLAYVFRPGVRRRIDTARHERGSKRLLPARGRWHDLRKIFRRLNERFFQGALPPTRLGWSLQRSRTTLGHYDSAHATIILSRLLDSPSVPRYLVEYLVFHEMLHTRYPVERRAHRRILHSREFREAERKFPGFERAHRKLKQILHVKR